MNKIKNKINRKFSTVNSWISKILFYGFEGFFNIFQDIFQNQERPLAT
ncbi:MAG TPA: hypothetical protein PLW94_01985 [Candidatus Absconditabacterales bacterium]|nr:hypothetical protein [Candidatus Absconditabacterales bacterium]